MPEQFVLDQHHVLRVPALSAFEWLEHGFSTRDTGAWPDAARLIMLKQIHSARVVPALDGAGYIGEGDALVTNHPGTIIGVRTADCVPILLADVKHRAVASVHAGWRGSAEQIVTRAVSEMHSRFETRPGDLYAAIGPSIRKCCYEVGPEVARQFSPWFPALASINGSSKLDLPEANRRQLIEAGLSETRIFSEAPCTFCTPGAFHSYRRDGERAGRMVSAISIRENR